MSSPRIKKPLPAGPRVPRLKSPRKALPPHNHHAAKRKSPRGGGPPKRPPGANSPRPKSPRSRGVAPPRAPAQRQAAPGGGEELHAGISDDVTQILADLESEVFSSLAEIGHVGAPLQEEEEQQEQQQQGEEEEEEEEGDQVEVVAFQSLEELTLEGGEEARLAQLEMEARMAALQAEQEELAALEAQIQQQEADLAAKEAAAVDQEEQVEQGEFSDEVVDHYGAAVLIDDNSSETEELGPPAMPKSSPPPVVPDSAPPTAAVTPISLPPVTNSSSPSSASPRPAPPGTRVIEGVVLGSGAGKTPRTRRLTMAVDLDAFNRELQEHDVQSKRTNNKVKGLRGLVSKKKKRFIDGKYDLDLAYITDRLIAMGFPSSGKQGIIRNPIKQVEAFFEERHKNHYKVYNLCSERKYSHVPFKAPVAQFGFDDHNPPPMEMMHTICTDVAEWLAFDERNIAALHCKAGKGRTGTVIAAYICTQYRGKGIDSQQALDFFAERRTLNSKGVTIPSQIRFVHWYYQAITQGIDFAKSRPLYLTKIIMHGLPNIDGRGGVDPYFVVNCACRDLVYDSRTKQPAVHMQGASTVASFDTRIIVDKDVKVQFYHDSKEKKEKLRRLLHSWVNTHFVGDDMKLVFELERNEIDGVKKTRKLFPPTFKLEFRFERMDN